MKSSCRKDELFSEDIMISVVERMRDLACRQGIPAAYGNLSLLNTETGASATISHTGFQVRTIV